MRPDAPYFITSPCQTILLVKMKSKWLIYILYWHIWLLTLPFSIQRVSHALEITINFYYPTIELFCLSFTQPLPWFQRFFAFFYSSQKLCLPNPFLFCAATTPRPPTPPPPPPPPINNDRSLIKPNFCQRIKVHI